ncbi:hypothetical protein JX266_010271 [Neoarthrinium moseri]|nr:hypothetical protein JX266_010271 [Neoarthrinium moseri]
MSSTPRPARGDTYLINSSSPDLPSLGELFRRSPKRAPPLRSGSNAAPIPTTARSTFASAADILREAPEIDIDTETITHSPPPRKPKAPRKPRAKALASKEADAPAEVALSPKRFKSKKSLEDNQPSLPRARVTKSTAPDKKRTRKTTETVSNHFPAAEEPEAAPPEPQEPAVARRNDWTPPRANTVVILDSESDNRELLSSAERPVTKKDVFGTLLDAYGCRDTGTATENEAGLPAQPAAPAVDILRKRKRLELVAVGDERPAPPESESQGARVASPSKPPLAKKKAATTITSLATAPYMPQLPEIDLLAPGNKETLLQYFDGDGNMKSLVEHQSALMDHEKSKVKKPAAKPRKKKKSATVEDPVLYSPSSALRQSVNQGFVFGTSSQLILEDSPTMLRDLQAAIKASNQPGSDPFASSPTSRAKGLWHAGARDVDGDLLGAEVVDLVAAGNVAVNDRSNLADPAAGLRRDEFVDIGDICSSSPQAGTGSTDPSSRFWQPQGPIASSAMTSTTLSEGSAVAEEAKAGKEPEQPQRPKYDLFTDAQLAKQVTAYGFKPLKRRQAMVALLDQCWASQHPGMPTVHPAGPSASMSTSASLRLPKQKSPARTAASKASTTAEPVKKSRSKPKKADEPVASVLSASPKRGRGRPRKVPAATSDAAVKATTTRNSKSPTQAKGKRPAKKTVEIADSDDDISLSSDSSPERVFSSPPPVDLSTTEDGVDMSLNLSPTDQEATMFSHITKAVTSAPRSKDPTNPSWHEKMLLYDPIVLEDLAAWLNGGQLTRVGYDGEVSPGEVKKWCESKSIICLWRVNVRGKERKRY